MLILVAEANCKKIVVLGNPGVGKTSIIKRYVHDQFSNNYVATLGFNIYTRYIEISDMQVGLSIWDIGGQEAFKKFAFRYLIEADAAVFVVDVTRLETLNDLKMWIGKLEEVIHRKIPKIILFNKIDLDYNVNNIADEITLSKIGEEFNGIVFASAKTGENINDIFSMIAQMLTNWNEEFGVPIKQQILFTSALDEEVIPVIFFTSNNCDWCQPAFDSINKLSNDFPMKVKVVNIDLDQQYARDFGIVSLPTTIIGSKTIVGAYDEKIIRSIIKDEYSKIFIG